MTPFETPVVGYMGGKRRLAKRIVDLMPARLDLYVEPFVGMGAVYLRLRSQRYGGLAVLADAHPCVSAFWKIIHDRSASVRLIDACRNLTATTNADDFYSAAACSPGFGEDRVARFLWLTNYSYSNRPPGLRNERWYVQGCKLTSAAKYGHLYPWENVVERVRRLAIAAEIWSVEVLDDAVTAIRRSTDESVTYADPPYAGTSEYQATCKNVVDELKAARGFVMLSEMANLPLSWPFEPASVVARVSNASGAVGVRQEGVYIKPFSPKDPT